MEKRALGCLRANARAVVRKEGTECGSCMKGGMLIELMFMRQSRKRSRESGRWDSLAATAWPSWYSSGRLRSTPDL